MKGIWIGALRAGGIELRLQLHLDLSAQPATASLDSLDQRALGIPCANVVYEAGALSLDVPSVGGHLRARLSADGATLEGSWSQNGTDLSLVMRRQEHAVGLVETPFDPALPPVALGALREVLDGDLAATVAAGGELAPGTGSGVTVGVVLRGEQLILSYGAAKDDSVYEIGSITKTFTGLLLAQLVAKDHASLDEPVRLLLPPDTVAAPAAGPEITLLDLSVHRSGLPRMPGNFAPADPFNPYIDYDAAALYAFLAEHGVARPADARPAYSNLGVGLLGQALAERERTPYEELLRREILEPLKMHETALVVTESMRARFPQGHRALHREVPHWDMGVLAGAGAVRSTAADMLVYLAAQLHPGDSPLATAIMLSHELRDELPSGARIALGWMYSEETRTFWHSGATGGFSAYASFTPTFDCAVVVLSNMTVGPSQLTDNLGRHIEARVQGRPAIAIGR